MGDATCCLLTCEEMIAHHLITTIHNGAACEVKTIYLSYQATNFAWKISKRKNPSIHERIRAWGRDVSSSWVSILILSSSAH